LKEEVMKGFRNEPLTDFSRPRNRAAMEKALKKVERELGKKYSPIIGGKKRHTARTFHSISPSDPDVIVGTFAKADARLACEAVETAYEHFSTWKNEKPSVRAGCLFKMARIMRRRKHELSAFMVYEVGKSWVEADADVAEAIDFCEFYGREALRYAGEQPLTRIRSEKNELRYIPLGVGVVIPPWNFPFAILAGMTTAALVAGNTVVLKPSSDSPTMGAKFMEVAIEAGIPAGVLNFLPGSGRDAGESAVAHPKTRFIAFTGSKEVGLRIVEIAAKHMPGQIWIKRVIAEMGGKDTIIVDSDTDLDEAVDGVLRSAYGFQGQKCSACSRVVVVAGVYKKFIDKLVPRVEALKVGPTRDFGNYMGPVVNKGAEESIMNYIKIGKTEGKLVAGGKRLPGKGYFIRPTVIKDVKPHAVISQEEIFGPVLAVLKARNFDHALEIANNTEYGLTGAVYTRNRKKIEKVKDFFHVGNLYINRGCTGALVGVHPFGGFNMSGTDSKAGGRDYLLLFTQAKAISEKVRKRGSR
jgi:1-pyrroline-5-carboxylate dehydrogenase